jgi:hypothetical protein
LVDAAGKAEILNLKQIRRRLNKMGEHSDIGASSAYRWMNCPGSVRVLKTVPKTFSEYADEGTVAHMVGEKALKEGKSTSEQGGLGYSINGRSWVVSEEMAYFTQIYVDFIKGLVSKPEQLTVEHKFNLNWLHPGMYGTCDALVETEEVMWVNDLKYGAGVFVDPEENPQLMYYGLGALGPAGGKDPKEVNLVIVQPRVDPEPQIWVTTAEYLREWGRKKLLPAAIATKNQNAPLIAGPWCHKTFCAYLGKCPAAAEQAVALAKSEFAAPMRTGGGPPPPESLTPERLAQLLRMIYWADKMKGPYEEYATHLLKNGEKLPGLKLVKKRSNRIYVNPESSRGFFKEFLKDEAFEPAKLKSPAQMEAAWKKRRKEPFPFGHIIKPEAGTTLAMEEDKRTAVEAVSPIMDFIMDEDFMK